MLLYKYIKYICLFMLHAVQKMRKNILLIFFFCYEKTEGRILGKYPQRKRDQYPFCVTRYLNSFLNLN